MRRGRVGREKSENELGKRERKEENAEENF